MEIGYSIELAASGGSTVLTSDLHLIALSPFTWS